MTFEALTAALLAGLGALNLALLAAALAMLSRIRRRMKRARKAERAMRQRIEEWTDPDRNAAASQRTFDRSIWPQIESLVSLYRLLDGKVELPTTRGWSASPDFLLHVVRHMRRHAPKKIVECGSGASTIVMAHTLHSLGNDGHIYSIENFAPIAEEVREQLRRRNLERFVTLIVVPLAEKRYDRFEAVFHWYDLDPNALPSDIDLLVVDGPFSMGDPNARYPAGPELLPKLSRDAHVFVDGAERPDQSAMVRQWRIIYPDLGIRRLATGKGGLELFFLDRKIEAYLPREWKEGAG